MFESFSAFLDAVLAVFPNATIDQDEDGQYVVNTNMTNSGDESCPVVDMGD